MIINTNYFETNHDASKLISGIHFSGDETITTCANKLKLPVRRARYIFEKLLNQKIISRRVVLNISNTGYIRYVFRMQATFNNLNEKKEWFAYATSLPEISTLYELSGDVTLAIIFYVKSGSEALNIIDRLTSHKAINVINTYLSERIRYRLLRNRLFHKSNLKTIALREDTTTPRSLIDQLDIKILGALAQPEFLLYTDMARYIAVPYPTFINRVKQLYEKKVIIGQVMALDLALLGYSTFLICVNLRKKRFNVDQITETLYEKTTGVNTVLETLGDAQYEFITDVKDSHELSNYISLLQMLFKDDLTGVRTLQILKYHKHAQGSFLKAG